MAIRLRGCNNTCCRNIPILGTFATLLSHLAFGSKMTTSFNMFSSQKDSLPNNNLQTSSDIADLGPSHNLSSSVIVLQPSEESSFFGKISQPRKPKIDTKRPERLRHSYLKLMLDSKVWDELHSTTLLLRDQYQYLLNSQTTILTPVTRHHDLNDHEISEAIHQTPIHNDLLYSHDAIKRRTTSLGIKPRSKQSLHLTFFFGGQVLCALPKEELTQWHTDILGRIKRISKVDIGHQVPAHDYTISFHRLRLFPPKRNSLIVAEFHVSPPLYSLYEDMVTIALSSTTTHDMLARVVDRKHERWVAHVTLADVPRSLRKADIDLLETLLDETNLNLSVQVQGLTMGGPYPKQNRNLDWNFYF